MMSIRPAPLYWQHPLTALLLMGIIGFACVPKESSPGPKTPVKAKAEKNALKVSFAAPQKSASVASQISIVMSRPMRALSQAEGEPPSFVTLSPKVPGKWQWLGTQALQFQPSAHLPRATSFRIDIPAGTKALDGTSLKEAFTMQFETSRPKALRTEPKNQRRSLPLDTAFTLHFNQPIGEEDLKNALSLSARPSADKEEADSKENSKQFNGKSIEFEIKYPDPNNHSVLSVKPKAPLPKASDIQMSIAKTLKGKEGPLLADEISEYSFHTHGALQVLEIQCDKSEIEPSSCESSSSGLELIFSNPVSEEEARANISIEPAIPFEIVSSYENEGRGSLILSADWEHSKSYQIKVRAGLRDERGEKLERDWQGPLRTGPRRPDIVFGFSGSTFLSSDFKDISIVSVNKEEIDFAYAPLDESALMKLFTPPKPGFPPEMRDLPPAALALLPRAIRKQVNSKAALNKPFVLNIPSRGLLDAKTHKGAFALSYTLKFKDFEQARSALVQSTDMAISAKVSNFGSLARLTRVSTGEPISGARFSILKPGDASKAIEFISDSNGFVNIPAQSFRPEPYLYSETAIFAARSGDDWTFLPANQTVVASNGWASVSEPLPFGLVFSERRLYRPGESAHIKGIVRQEARAGVDVQARIPAGKKIQIRLQGEDRKFIYENSATLTRFGTFSLDAKIPETAALGYVHAEAELEGQQMQLENTIFEIAEYRPNEIKVDNRAQSPSYIRGDKASFAVHAQSYSGMPLAGQSLNIVFWREKDAFRPPNLPENFSFDDEAFSSARRSTRRSLISRTELALNAFGDGKFDAIAEMDDQIGPERLVCSAEVEGAGAQPVASRASALVHPGEFYLAISQGSQDFVREGSDLKPLVLAVDPKGNTISNVKVHIELFERKYEKSFERSYRSKAEERLLVACDIQTRAQPESCTLPLKNAGTYILRAQAEDKKGHKIAASQLLYVARRTHAKDRFDGESVDLDLIADRMHYNIGDTAKILVKSPFEKSEALVTIERAGIYSKRLVELSGPSPTLEIPITEQMWPNAFVSVLLTHPLQKNEGASSAYRFGVVPISLRPEEKKLALALKTDKNEAAPGSPLNVEIDVRDPKGRPAVAEVTLYAVDEGTLSLTDEKKPEPLAVFAEHRGLGVATLESRDLLGKFLSPEEALKGFNSVRMGAGHGSLGARERRDFRPTAYYNPSLLSDAKGKIKVSFKLPDSLTSYRIVAVAVQEGDMTGSAETLVRTAQDLMLRPIAPRFFRAGDIVSAGAVISSRLAGRNEFEFTMQSEGLDALDGAGEMKKRLTLEKNQSQEMRFSWKANRAGKARMRMSVRALGSSKASDALLIERDIQWPMPLESVALHGQTSSTASEKIGPLLHVRDDVGGLSVELSNSALAGLSGSVEQLLDYPYACTEQSVSRLLALIVSRELWGGRNTMPSAEQGERVKKILAQIEYAQRKNGSFGYWPNSPMDEPFVSAYALLGLSLAKENGMAVRDSLFNSSIEFLMDWLNYRSQSPFSYADAVFVADALVEAEMAKHGQIKSPLLPKLIHNIVQQRKKLLPSSLAMLLHAAAKAGGAAASAQELLAMQGELEAFIRLDGPHAQVIEALSEDDNSQLDSSARTTALVLRALLAVNAEHPLGQRLALGLLSARNASGWRTTQENAWALLALSQYKKLQENKERAFSAIALLSGKELGRASFEGRDSQSILQAPISSLLKPQTLDIQVAGEGKLFYSARLKYAPSQMPQEPLEHGFFIQRSQRALRVEDLAEAISGPPGSDENSFKEGDLVLVDLLLVVPTPRDHIAVEDPIAAGLEPVNTAFATTSEWLSNAIDEGRGRSWENSPYARAWHREELRDDRALFFMGHAASGLYRFQYLARAITPGTFQRPPAMVQQMYAPEIFGRSAGSVLSVREKTPQ